MDELKWKKTQQAKRNEERKRLLEISDIEAERLPIAEKYQRIRCKHEMLADEWLEQQRRATSSPPPLAKKVRMQKTQMAWSRD